MKSYPKIILVLAIFFSLIVPVNVFAQTDDTFKDRTVMLGKDETVEHDYFNAGKKVIINGVINGDAYVAGGQVDINGKINGDLLVAGGQVTIRGEVAQNIRAVGGEIFVQGSVGRNITLVGGSLVVDKGASVMGNATLAGGSVNILSPVKNLALAAGDVSLQSTILGDVTGAVGELQVFPEATVGGNLTYWSDKKANISPQASVTGSISFNQTNFESKFKSSSEKSHRAANNFGLFISFISLMSAALIGLLLIKFMPVFSAKTSGLIFTKFWKSVTVGFVALVVTPVLVVILFMSLLGIPMAIFIAFLYGVSIYLSKIFVAMAIGKYASRITKWNLSLTWEFVLGILLFYVVGYIPVVGFIMKFLVLVAGVGALLLSKKEYVAALKKDKII